MRSASVALVLVATLGCAEAGAPPPADPHVQEDAGAPTAADASGPSPARFDLACGHSGELWGLVIDTRGAPTSCDDRWEWTTDAIRIWVPYRFEVAASEPLSVDLQSHDGATYCEGPSACADVTGRLVFLEMQDGVVARIEYDLATADGRRFTGSATTTAFCGLGETCTPWG